MLRAKAAQLGVSSAAEVYIRKMEQAGKATHSLGLKSAAARQEIGVLIGELARGNLGALRGSGITLATHSLSGTAASAGAHAHTVSIGAHTHSVAIGSHGHTITVNAAGNAENTVKNIAFNYIVRLA
ncbi:hypothetical protein VEE32_07780 [Escherichia coli]|nr:hypothetical protein VEE32_07780 [Escherichia coli]